MAYGCDAEGSLAAESSAGVSSAEYKASAGEKSVKSDRVG